ncbi:OLC1v1028273C1 [Oldenlandia corymbosa var. corymbosa]|uniref:OLC1v1028273C1 n=1 Tax=Oldenlandia corymbosa var. corymbosa TaxID=529605 RepID=A0AAV1CBW3_OLDCO|nr:OLC1v1028273C1 [Oldenlandia corymbosa var. corymbosa]
MRFINNLMYVSTNSPPNSILLDKASPLDAVELATFSRLADQNSLSTKLHTFCKQANLFCFPEKHNKDVNFAVYERQNFTNYGNDPQGAVDSFKNYTDYDALPIDSFRRYSRGSSGHDDQFTNYGLFSNEADQTLSSYGTKATGGIGIFSNYNNNTNIPGLTFTSYSDSTNGRTQDFQSYSSETMWAIRDINNVVSSTFNNYGETGNGANDYFTSYGGFGNFPTTTFNTYARDGDDSFQFYAQGSNAQALGFTNYGQSFDQGSETLKGYAKNSTGGTTIDFKTYGINNTFKDYAKTGITFSDYRNGTGSPLTAMATSSTKKINCRWVEPGKFFREKMLKTGTVMPMPDTRDKMPKGSFLSRTILSKLPFSTSKIDELKKIFYAADGSSMTRMMTNTLNECERAPSPGETKRCVGSAEDMVDFATSVLGKNVAVRTTENTQGSGKDIMIGTVTGINGGRVTKSVSCHQSLYPYLLYYCHFVPKVRVYEADILDPSSKAKLNHEVAICHIDTSSWSQTHGAFLALGSGPGKTEVCHWIFRNDMTWTISD